MQTDPKTQKKDCPRFMIVNVAHLHQLINKAKLAILAMFDIMMQHNEKTYHKRHTTNPLVTKPHTCVCIYY